MNNIPPLKDSSGLILLADKEKPENIANTFGKAYFTTFLDRSYPRTEAKFVLHTLT